MITRAISTVTGGATLLAAILIFPSVSRATLTEACLIGTAPDVVNDASQIQAVRSLIDTLCVCAHFDGSKGKTHANYAGCAAGIVTAEVDAAALRRQCKRTVKLYYSNSTCGRNPNQHPEPCIQTNASTAKITCTIKATTKKDGVTPTDACSNTAKAARVACTTYTQCIDAADTNGDLIIGAPGDSGSCVAPPTATPTYTPTATSTPAVTPTIGPIDTATATLTATPTGAKGNGQACAQNNECTTGFCVDGVCCNMACTGACKACTTALTGQGNGVCSDVTAGMADPNHVCLVEGAATCGTTGTCAAAAMCQLYPNGTSCAPASCSGSIFTPAATCNGGGGCVGGTATDCAATGKSCNPTLGCV